MAELGVQKMTKLQLELLKIYSFNPTKLELVEIKKILATFFAKRLITNVGNVIKDNNISNDDLEKWLNE